MRLDEAVELTGRSRQPRFLPGDLVEIGSAGGDARLAERVHRTGQQRIEIVAEAVGPVGGRLDAVEGGLRAGRRVLRVADQDGQVRRERVIPPRGVVAPYLCGYGGDVFAVVWDGQLHGYLGSGRSPAAASIEAVRDRAESETMPVLGPHAVTVPGGVAGWFDILERWGTRSFGELAEPALAYARDGFELTPMGAMYLGGSLAMYEGSAALRSTYEGVEAGDVLRQPGLARTIEALAADGPDAYYRGPIANAIADSHQAGGGLLTVEDLVAHSGEFVAPLRASYRDVEIA